MLHRSDAITLKKKGLWFLMWSSFWPAFFANIILMLFKNNQEENLRGTNLPFNRRVSMTSPFDTWLPLNFISFHHSHASPFPRAWRNRNKIFIRHTVPTLCFIGWKGCSDGSALLLKPISTSNTQNPFPRTHTPSYPVPPLFPRTHPSYPVPSYFQFPSTTSISHNHNQFTSHTPVPHLPPCPPPWHSQHTYYTLVWCFLIFLFSRDLTPLPNATTTTTTTSSDSRSPYHELPKVLSERCSDNWGRNGAAPCRNRCFSQETGN